MRVRHRRAYLVACFVVASFGHAAADERQIYQDAQVAEKLKNGDTTVRKAIIRELFVEPKKILTLDDSFLDAFMASADDPDSGVKHTSIALIGERWIWKGGKQDLRAVAFLLKRTHDDDETTRYDCVYYGLSAMRSMSDVVIDRLIELAVKKDKHERKSVFGRVLWGFRANADRAAPRIQAYLDRHDGDDSVTAIRAMNLYFELTKSVPARLKKFADTGKYGIVFSPKPPFLPRTEAEVKERVLALANDPAAVSDLKVGSRDGRFFGIAFVVGMPSYGHVLGAMRGSEQFQIPLHGLATRELTALEDRVFQQQGPSEQVPYEQAFTELYETLGREYPCFELKGINWQAVGKELLPVSRTIRTQDEFALLCQRLIARLEDSHAHLLKGTAQPAAPPFPRWDPGFACLIDDLGNPVVYFVNSDSPAESAGVRIGMTIVTINGTSADQALEECMKGYREYVGFSSERLLRYQAVRWFIRQDRQNDLVRIVAVDTEGTNREFKMPATMDVRYLPRLPVPIDGISDSADVSWKRFDDGIGYIYVRRIRRALNADLDKAVAALKECTGLIIDVRGNSGGGFDAASAFRNFDLANKEEPERPRFTGPMAVLIDARCISAGEGWASWFAANQRARFFGEATAGASSRKRTVKVCGGLFRAVFPVKAYKGFLDRPIERIGLEPDVAVKQTAKDLEQGTDTVLQAAREYSRKQKSQHGTSNIERQRKEDCAPRSVPVYLVTTRETRRRDSHD